MIPTVVLVPVKRISLAKSRLAPLGDVARRELALAFALDTLATAVATPGVAAVVAVTDDPAVAAQARDLGAGTAPDRPDLNLALRSAGAAAREATGVTRLLALCADLPGVGVGDLSALLAERSPRGFVVDHRGRGTTALLDDTGWSPCFGPASARRHRRAGYPELDATPALRTDVDVPDDLDLVRHLGLAPRTAEVVARLLT